MQPINHIHSLIIDHTSSLLSDLNQTGEPPRPAATVEVAKGWTVLVAVFPSNPTAEPETITTQCDKDCLALLAQLQRPLSAARICKELEKRGIGIWAEITVKRSLAKLVKLGLVSNSRHSPRGYYLPESLPLVRAMISKDTKL